MDWSKKIGIGILLVLVLSACASRNNYGSVFFSNGDVYGDSLSSKELSATDYMSYADSVNDYFGTNELSESEDADSLDSISNQEEQSLVIDSLNKEQAVSEDSKIPDSLIFTDSIPDDFVIVKSVELVKVDSLTTVDDSLVIISDSLNEESMDSSRVIKAPNSTKIIYTDTIGIILEKELDEDTGKVLKQKDNNATPKSKAVVSQQNDSLNNEKEVIDTTNTNNESSENTIIEKTNLKDDTTATVNNDVRVLGVVGSETESEIETDTVTIIKENHLNTKKIDSLKSINDELRLESNFDDSEIDTLIYSVFFDSNQQSLSSSNKEILMNIVNKANGKNYVLQLSGHTDRSGSEEYNKTLSENRVKTVLKYVVANGLDEKNIYFQSFGETYASGDSDLNRRVVSCRLIVQD